MSLRAAFAVCALVAGLQITPATARKPAGNTDTFIDARADTWAQVALQIWDWAELGYQEQRSSALLQDHLRAAGFTVTTGVADIPTAFIAEYGSGRPVIGILAEFDALPGLSQAAVPHREPVVAAGAGHACGHHLFGAGSLAGALATADWLQRSSQAGTIRLYGTPAEEGGSGKVYMVRAGLFDDADAVLHWHPRDRNDAWASTSLANKSAKFRFHGTAAHAASAPDRGRSALDGVEAMNHMVNLMREHVPQETRIHYVITRGGAAPNIVPEFAEAFYYVRHPDVTMLHGVWDRVVAASEGAALGTGTRVEHEIIHGNYNVVPNETLSHVMHSSLQQVGGVVYTTAERAFAESLRTTFDGVHADLVSAAEVQPWRRSDGKASTDVGDVSWTVPTTGLSTATWVPGTAAHSWQAVAGGGTSIGVKGMIVAGKTLARTAIALFQTPETLTEARAELDRHRGNDYVHVPLLGDRAPPLDYRD
jgi:aminobenzoyl-glutamate utilization protein B